MEEDKFTSQDSQSHESEIKQNKLRAWGLFTDWFKYFAKAVILLFFVFWVSQVSPNLLTWQFGIWWAVLSAGITFCFAYFFLFRKMRRQVMFLDGGRLSRLNNGRTLTIIVSFILAGVCSLGLIIESVKWEAEWSLIFLAVILYPLFFHLLEKPMSKEFSLNFKRPATIRATNFAVLIFLLITFFVLAFQTKALPGTIDLPFKDSPSSAVQLIGLASGFTNSLAYCLVNKFSAVLTYIGFIYKVITYAMSLAGLTALLDLCAMNASEIRATVASIEDVINCELRPQIKKRYIALLVVLPVVLTCLFISSDIFVDSHVDVNQLTTKAEGYLQSIVNPEPVKPVNPAYESSDGDNDNQIQESEDDEDSNNQDESSSNDEDYNFIKDNLKQTVNTLFDYRKAHIDDYLDWYYSPCGVYFREQHDNDEEALSAFLDNGLDSSSFPSILLQFVSVSSENDLSKFKPDLNPVDYGRYFLQGKQEAVLHRKALKHSIEEDLDKEQKEILSKIDALSFQDLQELSDFL